MIVVSSNSVSGREIAETKGMAMGSAVRARGLLRDITALIRNIFGGRIPEYAELLTQTRDEATAAMIRDAEAQGADAVVAVRYTTSMIASGTSEILAYGTAVKLAD